MFCEKCGNPVGESERFCSQCGAPLPVMEPAAEPAAAGTETPAAAETEAAAATTAAAETEAAATTAAATAAAETETAATTAAATTAAAAEPVPTVSLAVPQVQEAPIAPAIPVEKPEDSSRKSKKKKKKAPWIIAACVLVAVVIICAANSARLGNFFRRSFSSPEKYYQYVEEKTVSALAEMSEAYYDMLVMDSRSMDGRNIDMEFEVELGKDGQELIELLEMADVDLTWLKGLSMGIGYSLQDSLFGYNLSFGLNKADILSLRSIMDLEKGAMYLQVPELTADYIGLDMDEYTGGDWAESLEVYEEMQEELAAVQKAMPDTKEVEKLLQKYLKLALSGVSDVEKSTKTLKVGGVQQKYTELEVTFDGKSLSRILKVVLKEIPKDKDFKKLFVSTVDNLQELDETWSITGEDAWDEFTEEVEEMLDSLDELEDMDDVLVMKVYVDGMGKIAGRVFELVEDRETFATVSILSIEKGGRFGCEFSVQSGSGYGGELALTGSGRKSGNKLTGDFELKYNGISVLDLKVSDFDRKQMEKGYLNGSITMTFSKQISNLLSTSLSYYGTAYASMLADMQITMDFQMAENTGKMIMGIGYGEKDLASISMSVEAGDGSGVRVPDANNTVFVEDEDDLEEWLKKINWESFIERLEQADLPDEIIDLLEEVSYLLTIDGGAGLLYHYDDYYGDDYFGDDYYGDDYFSDDYFGDDYFSDDYFGDDYYGDDYFSDDYSPDDYVGDDYNEGWGSDNNSDDTYGSGLLEDENSLALLLQSDAWQEELKSWNEQVDGTGVTITTEADGNTLVFSWNLPDDDFFGSLDGDQCEVMADTFLDILESADFLTVFKAGYGISLDAVRCVFVRSDGTEIYRGEIY